MMTEEEIRLMLKMTITQTIKAQKAGSDVTYALGCISALRTVLGLRDDEEVA